MKKWNACNCKKGQSYLSNNRTLTILACACYPRKHDLILLKQLLGDV